MRAATRYSTVLRRQRDEDLRIRTKLWNRRIQLALRQEWRERQRRSRARKRMNGLFDDAANKWVFNVERVCGSSK